MSTELKTLEQRRSCRSYKREQVSAEDVKKVMDAGLWAPTAMDNQNVIMVAVQDRKTRDELSKLNASFTAKKDADPFYGAPTVVVVLAKPAANAFADGSGVLNYMMLEATELGLGSCWINRAKESFETDQGKDLLKKWGLEGEWVGIGNCILGYPAELGPKRERKQGREFFILGE